MSTCYVTPWYLMEGPFCKSYMQARERSSCIAIAVDTRHNIGKTLTGQRNYTIQRFGISSPILQSPSTKSLELGRVKRSPYSSIRPLKPLMRTGGFEDGSCLSTSP